MANVLKYGVMIILFGQLILMKEIFILMENFILMKMEKENGKNLRKKEESCSLLSKSAI